MSFILSFCFSSITSPRSANSASLPFKQSINCNKNKFAKQTKKSNEKFYSMFKKLIKNKVIGFKEKKNFKHQILT
jgi:hypothetical protein